MAFIDVANCESCGAPTVPRNPMPLFAGLTTALPEFKGEKQIPSLYTLEAQALTLSYLHDFRITENGPEITREDQVRCLEGYYGLDRGSSSVYFALLKSMQAAHNEGRAAGRRYLDQSERRRRGR